MWRELDLEKVEQDLRGVLSRGITSLAVLLLHSYTSVVQRVFVLLGTEVLTQDSNLLSCHLSFMSVYLSEQGTDFIYSFHFLPFPHRDLFSFSVTVLLNFLSVSL